MTQSAKIIADSLSPRGKRLISAQLRYPKFIHGELMTHRVFSRNASSSRAIPVERLIEDVLRDPAGPIHWGKNQKGMQAREENREPVENPWADSTYRSVDRLMTSQEAWLHLRDKAVDMARAFDRAGYHKQIVNRLIEPWCHINVIVTATEWSNFFALRCHPDAQPEMRDLAEKIQEAVANSVPVNRKPGEWHLPYVTAEEWAYLNSRAMDHESLMRSGIRISVARCARVSYMTHDGRKPDLEEDLRLHDRLLAQVPLHASPAEHQGTPDVWLPNVNFGEGAYESPELHGNFMGWVQYRKTLKGECQ